MRRSTRATWQSKYNRRGTGTAGGGQEKVIDPSLCGQHLGGRSQEHAKVGDAVTKTVAGKIRPNANKKILISSVSELLCEFHASPGPNVYLNQNDPSQNVAT
ncbi:hypothetical protein quinque_016464 [Culex quinquefasciatus]